MTSSRPQKKWYVHSKLASPGVPPRPMTHGCHGATVEMHGTPLASHWSLTGLVVSGVDATTIRSTASSVISFVARSAARLGSDSESSTRISTV